jgi:hypothetical protein
MAMLKHLRCGDFTKAGDLIEFWDYLGGSGKVTGLIVKIVGDADRYGDGILLTAHILYNNYIQQVLLNDVDWMYGAVNESR